MNLNKKYDFYKNSIYYLIANAVVCVIATIVILIWGFNYSSSVAGGYVLLQSVLVIIISLMAILLYIGLRYNFGKALSVVLICAHNALLSSALIAIIRVSVTEAIVAAYIISLALSTIFTLLLSEKLKDVNLKKADYNEVIKSAISSSVKLIVICCAALVILSLLCLISLSTNIFSFVRLLLVMIFVLIYSALTIVLPVYCFVSSKVKKINKAKVDTNVENQKLVKAVAIDGEEVSSATISENKE